MGFDWIVSNAGLIGELTVAHLWLTLLPTALGLVISIPLGYWASQSSRTYTPVVGTTSLFYTIPSLALFVLLPQVLGTQILDPVNVIVAVTIYTVALLVRVVADALRAVPAEVVQAADAMGYTPTQRLWKTQLPLCIPELVAGLRVVVVANVSIVTMSALIGVSQLGSLFTLGFTRRLLVPIITGLVVCLLLAALLDRVLGLAGRALTPWVRKGAKQ